MLDNLNMTSGSLKVLSQSWLVHSMTRGDVGRIMEPLFLTLLDPGTARVSVLHCNLQALEEDVFVIHAEKDVIFHVINNKDKSMSILQYNKKVEKQSKKERVITYIFINCKIETNVSLPVFQCHQMGKRRSKQRP